MFEKIKNYYQLGLWSKERVRNMVEKGVISKEEYETIVGEERE